MTSSWTAPSGHWTAPSGRHIGLWAVLVCLSTFFALGSEGSETSLVQGQTLERSLEQDAIHVFELLVDEPSYVWISVRQKGVDVVVRRLDAEGRLQDDHDLAQRLSGTEHVYLLVDSPGAQQIEIEGQSLGEKPGSYRLKVEEIRPLRPVDRLRVPQERIYDEAQEFLGPRREPAKALELFASTLPTWQELDDAAYEASTLDNMGFCYRRLEQVREAVAFYQQALPRWRDAKMPVQEANTWINLGAAQRFLDDFDGARRSYEKALALLEPRGELRRTASALHNLAAVHLDSGDLEGARVLLYRTRGLRLQVNDKKGLASTLNNLGQTLTYLGEMDEAFEVLGQSMELAETLDSAFLRAASLNNLGVAHEWAGEALEALRLLRQSLDINRELGHRAGQATVWRNLGEAYIHLGDFGEALRGYQQAAALHHELGRPADRAETLIQIGWLHLQAERPAEAVGPLREAVDVLENLGRPFFFATALEKLGRAEAFLGRLDEGRALLDRARLISRGIGDLRGETQVWLGQAELQERLGDLDTAARFYRQAEELSQQAGDRHLRIDAAAGLARVERGRGRWAQASKEISQALEITESIRTRAGGELLKATFLATRKDLYSFAIDLAMEQSKPKEAFRIHQRSRSRSLLDLVAGQGTSGPSSGSEVGPALLDEERTLRRELSAVERRLAESGRGRLAGDERRRLEAEHAERVRRHGELIGQIRRQAGESFDPEPLPLEVLQSEVLDPSTLLLVYALGDSRSFLWAIDQDTIESFELPGQEILAKAVRDYSRLLVLPAELSKASSVEARTKLRSRLDPAHEELQAAGAVLSQWLLAPVMDRLDSQTRLAFMAEGALQFLPFGALPMPNPGQSGDPLLASHEVVHLPSASVLGWSRRQFSKRPEPSKLLAVFADPVFESRDPRLLQPTRAKGGSSVETSSASGSTRSWDEVTLRGVPARLPHSAQEALGITQGLAPEQFRLATGFRASRHAFLESDLEDYRILHLATHGFLHPDYPQLSGLVFSLFDTSGDPVEGHLRLQDIADLRLSADLVVLSACETGLGQDIPGEGFLGLTHGFLRAGSARVLASLWPVDDAATAALMIHFYKALLDHDLSAAEALRRAQQSMQQGPEVEWRHPYFWGGFVLYGEWR